MIWKIKKQLLTRKQVGGHKLCSKYLIFFFILLFSKNLYSSQIYDYQTEKFIEKINLNILSVNSYDKEINFRIIKDDFPNAFVTEDSTLYLSSGLLVYSHDYVSLLGVLAHEIGHLEKYHVSSRKNEINNLKKLNSFGNLVTVVGSMIIQEPSIINTVILNQTSINNLFIKFTQEQEIEADFYAVETLNSLNLSTNSIKEFLLLLENKTKFDLIDDELKKFSTHPLFEQRYKILEFKETDKKYNYDKNLQNDFNFIKAKFIAYTENGLENELVGDYKAYYNAIKYAKDGNLKDSLKKINSLISKNNTNVFLIETKADILLSYGFSNEAINFYRKVLQAQPQNNYVKYNIFTNLNYKNKNLKFKKTFFFENINLIEFFPNNKILLTELYYLSKILNYKDWIFFFETLLFDKKNFNTNLKQLEKLTKDINLKKLIKLYS